ncbi:porin [Paraburkholderia susongensis]|uniref:Outer membrane protein (Porin) n=1 Tax=Paraburkholderia susongensis TaxID=1515439 RepID=A0A1X7M262_9BURK|nr:porin [Paraburkholderia susongensis]SMG59623.1 Outer membrane protein (porin) [Paraburkholderia susongensis]
MTTAVVVAAGLGVAPRAQAQSSVTMWGTLDLGISYISNIGGHSVWRMDNVDLPNLLGFSGSEDLGNGTHAIFRLVTQFGVNGNILALPNNGSESGTGLFAENAWVGLDNERYGKLTLGRQYDFMMDTLYSDVGADAARYGGGYYQYRDGPFGNLAIPGSPPGDGSYRFDHMGADTALDNVVKYTSPLIDGLRFGGMYAFGGTAGDFRENSADSFGLSYSFKPFAVGVAYTDIRYATLLGDSVRNIGVGASYNTPKLLLTALFTNTLNTLNGAMVNAVEVGALYFVVPSFSTSLAYTYMWGNAVVDHNHANQLDAVFKYHLSKRTAVYVQAVYQITNSGANALINGTFGSSSGNTQFIGRIGMQTTF